MRTSSAGLFLILACTAACSDGAHGIPSGGTAPPSGSGAGTGSPGSPLPGTGSGSPATSGGVTPASGSLSSGAESGSPAIGSGATSGSSLSGGETASGAASGASSGASPAAADPYSGPFKILVLSLTKGFHHDSIPAAHQLLRDLGQCVDAASCALTHDEFIAGTKPNSSFTVKIAGAPAQCDLPTAAQIAAGNFGEKTSGCDGNVPCANNDPAHCQQDPAAISQLLSEFSETNLKNYQLIFFANPTGNDFSSTGPAGQAGMIGIQKFMEGGGGYAGVHSATDFEKDSPTYWKFYTDQMVGSGFATHNGDTTLGNVVVQPQYVNHPVVRGLPANWNVADEWYCMEKDINNLADPNLKVLAQLKGVPAPMGCTTAGESRGAIWVKEFPAMDAAGVMKGRVVYTIRGHNISRYSEPMFRKLVHQGILWAVHRLE
jgi:type 1 glutamine amidotransferase